MIQKHCRNQPQTTVLTRKFQFLHLAVVFMVSTLSNTSLCPVSHSHLRFRACVLRKCTPLALLPTAPPKATIPDMAFELSSKPLFNIQIHLLCEIVVTFYVCL